MKVIAIAACIGLLGQVGGAPDDGTGSNGVGPGAARIIAADTIEVEGARIRLWGVSVARSAGPCPDYGPGMDCIAGALWELENLIKDYDVRCDRMGPEEPDGRRAGRCEVGYDECYGVTCQIRWRDVSEELVAVAVVVQDRTESGGRYDEVEQTARYDGGGVWTGDDSAGQSRRRRD
ncbi:hypothetical protein [Brevundimonas sp.]|uniref:hypothetical protein n=1 Tax=Brevundimonas sp. TaxID=1871086 RepID=UPI002D53CB88|nr:hypothetical protein [Brevundimonas sp.]HYC68965.1 hypothetical protein [Brevundimonas sp.]